MTHSVRYRQSAPRVAAICAATLCAAALSVALLAASPAAMAQTTPAATSTVQDIAGQNSGEQQLHAATRGVNVAIVALGSLWILLMIRRVQSVAALRHAEVGH